MFEKTIPKSGSKRKDPERKKIDDALLKVALGCSVEEVTEEYANEDGELKLQKRKRTKKDIPPDLKAVQMLLGDGNSVGLSALSDEELQKEKERLLLLLDKRRAKTEKTSKKKPPDSDGNNEQ